MNSHEFILKAITDQLLKDGHSQAVAERAAENGLDYYKSTAHFKKAVIDESIKHARQKAKVWEPKVKKAGK